MFDALKDALKALEGFLDGYGPLVTMAVFAGVCVLDRSLVGLATMLSVMMAAFTWLPRGGLR